MHTRSRSSRTSLGMGLAALALLAAAGCGGRGDADAAGTDAGNATAAGADGGAAVPAAGAPVTLGAADLDAYARGLRHELELVRAARARLAAAATPQERGAAVQAHWPDETMPRAAAAVAMPVARYRQLRLMVDEVLRTLDFQGKIDGPLTMDTARASAAARTRLARDPFAQIPAPSAAALRERLPELAPVWAEYTKLTTVGG